MSKKVVWILILFFLVACNEKLDKRAGLADEGGSGALACASLDYLTIQKTVLGPRCTACHGGAGGVNLESFAAVKASISSVERVIKARTMPRARPLPPAEEELILRWIGAGAPETASSAPEDCDPQNGVPGPAPAPRPLTPDYESLKERLFEVKCSSCHSAGGRLYDFSSYRAILNEKDELFETRRPERSLLYEVVIKEGRGAMPPTRSGIARVSTEEARVLLEWIRRGLPEKGETP